MMLLGFKNDFVNTNSSKTKYTEIKLIDKII